MDLEESDEGSEQIRRGIPEYGVALIMLGIIVCIGLIVVAIKLLKTRNRTLTDQKLVLTRVPTPLDFQEVPIHYRHRSGSRGPVPAPSMISVRPLELTIDRPVNQKSPAEFSEIMNEHLPVPPPRKPPKIPSRMTKNPSLQRDEQLKQMSLWTNKNSMAGYNSEYLDIAIDEIEDEFAYQTRRVSQQQQPSSDRYLRRPDSRYI